MSPTSMIQRVQFSSFELDLQSGELERNGRKVRLPGQSFQILQMLVERPGEVVTREELRQALWPGDTFVDFDSGLNNAMKRLRECLGDTAGKPRYIETLPRRGYRFLSAVSPVRQPLVEAPALPLESPEPPAAANPAVPDAKLALHPPGTLRQQHRWQRRWIFVAALLGIMGVGAFLLQPRKLQSSITREKIVLGEFTNRTAEPVFEETLRRGLAVELEQSPILSILPEQRVQQVLALMKQSPDAHLTLATAREVCERSGGTAVVDGSISQMGSHYVLWAGATNCRTGETLGEEQAEADHREDVLAALDAIARKLRIKIGESATSLQMHDKPLAEATTSSLEALRAYSAGVKIFHLGDPTAAIPLFKHAVELDPNFAAAWGYMACSCSVQPDIARANIVKAYALRDRTTEREKFLIEGTYYLLGTGELDKAMTAYEAWTAMYPQDAEPVRSLALAYIWTGQSDKAPVWAQKAILLEDDPLTYQFKAFADINLNRLDAAQSTYEEMERHKLETFHAYIERYRIAFLRGDRPGMNRWAAAAVGKLHAEDELLATQADTAAWFGDIKKARTLVDAASDVARRSDAVETAGRYQAYEALTEAEFGNRMQARSQISAALRLSPNRDVRQIAPLVMAKIGDLKAARALTSELVREDALGTWTQQYFLPAIQASVALQENDPQHAVMLLQDAKTIELAFHGMLTAELRGEAFLRLGRGDLAAAEYQKFLEHRGLVRNSPQGALARLGLARAYAMQGDLPKARKAYSEFLTLWKDADPSIPLLQEAKREALRISGAQTR